MGQNQGRPVLFTDEVKLDHFKLLRVVGKGAFGKVRIVERKDSGLTFALKYIRKDEVVRSENVRNIVRERRMLEHLNHPFLCNLRYSFQDYDYLYLVVDLMSGGDLRFHISRKCFHESVVRFWIAELGCALRYIHKQGVVHRDVKPDNILLDSEGHVHLADFNVASDFSASKRLTSKSGTLAYLAPEVYGGHGYRSEVDWWSLGVVFYECIYNKRPFDAHSHHELSDQVLAASPKYPRTDPPIETTCTSAIQSLLTKKMEDRIGANSWATFTDHPFFVNYGIEFDALERKEIRPVFIPASDKTNFDATYDLEELLLEEAPLEARTKHMKPRAEPKPDATPQEKRAAELHRMIEQLFEPFDYTQASFEKLPDAPDEPTHLTHENARRIAASSSSSPSSSQTNARSPHRRPPVARSPSGNMGLSREDTGSPPLITQVSLQKMSERLPPLPAGPTSNPDRPKPTRSKSVSNPSGGTGSHSMIPPSGPSVRIHSASPPTEQLANKKRGALLGFLTNKKSKEAAMRRAENGVLGKGARTIIGD